MTSVFINGKWLEGKGENLQSINPANLQVVWNKKGANSDQVKQAVECARSAGKEWAKTSIEKRIDILKTFADLLKENQKELANIISFETGKPDWEALTEVTAMANKVAISIAAQANRAHAVNGYQGSNQSLNLAHRPHGVMAVYGPYNFPGHLPNGHIVPALLAGNTVVFKPSEETPWTAERTVELWAQAGLPSGVLNLVQGAKEAGVALAKQDLNGLLFTGSSTTGKILHQQFAGRPEVLLALEMGGNNPLIVDDNVNVDQAINIVLQSAFLSAGQRCTCTRRLILVRSEQTQSIIDGLQSNIAKLIVGNHDDQPEPFMGPVVNQQTVRALLSAQEELARLGGRILSEVKMQSDQSYLLSPGLIDMTGAKPSPDEEWFGPLLQLRVVNTFDEALELANDTRFGLAAGLISDDVSHQHQFQLEIEAGVVSINQPTAGASSELPFGGVGASGNHRPSAFYAADYCAWPQALTQGEHTQEQNSTITRGIRK